MNESEGGTKRATSEEKETSLLSAELSNKKQKLDTEELSRAIPVLPTTLVLDKLQEDTINQLVQCSTAVPLTGGLYKYL